MNLRIHIPNRRTARDCREGMVRMSFDYPGAKGDTASWKLHTERSAVMWKQFKQPLGASPAMALAPLTQGPRESPCSLASATPPYGHVE